MLKGHIDEILNDYIRGWCVNKTEPHKKPVIRIMRGDDIIIETAADRYRADLVDFGDDGNLGFEADFDALPDFKQVKVWAVLDDEEIELRFSRQNTDEDVAEANATLTVNEKLRTVHLPEDMRTSAPGHGKWLRREKAGIFTRIPSPYQFNINPATGQKRLVLLLPMADPSIMDSNADTALLLAGELAKRGANILVLALSAEPRTSGDFHAYLHVNLGIDGEAVSRIQVADARNGFILNIGDKIMSAASWAFPLGKFLAKRCGHIKPAYLINDIDPLFIGFGVNQAALMLAYDDEYLPIIKGQCVAEMLFALGHGSFATEEYRRQALILEPCIDERLYYPQEHKGITRKLFVDTRLQPTEIRNAPALVLEAIARMVEDEVMDPHEWKIISYGDYSEGKFEFANGWKMEAIPPLPAESQAELIRAADLGVALSLSPQINPVALQLAACGVPVITNTYLNKTAQYLEGLSSCIQPVKPTYDSVASKLRVMIQSGITKNGQACGPSHILMRKDIDQAWSKVVNGLFAWYEAE